MGSPAVAVLILASAGLAPPPSGELKAEAETKVKELQP